MADQSLSNKTYPRKAMLFAAGLGTRLKPWTDHHPKALALVNGKSLLQRNIEYLQQHGIRDVVVNVHHFADQIVDAVQQNDGWGSSVTISDETAEVLETGGGLLKAAPLFSGEENIVVMNADILTNMPLSAMMVAHVQSHPLATLAVSKRETSRYFLFDKELRLSGWENVKTGEVKKVRDTDSITRMAFSGIHIVHTKLFSLITRAGKFSMVDVYLDLAAQHTISGFDHTGSLLLDVGKPESLLKAETLFA